MKLAGVIPFPEDFAKRYRAEGYWDDRLLIEHWEDAFASFADRVAVIDDESSWTYAELDAHSTRLARVLLDLGLQPLDRVVVQLPNTNVFAAFYVALQRIGVIPIMALPSHRFREVEQFVRLSGAVALASPLTAKDADFGDIFRRVSENEPSLRWHFTLGGKSQLALEDLMSREPASTVEDLLALRAELDPEDPAVFQLSGGTSSQNYRSSSLTQRASNLATDTSTRPSNNGNLICQATGRGLQRDGVHGSVNCNVGHSVVLCRKSHAPLSV